MKGGRWVSPVAVGGVFLAIAIGLAVFTGAYASDFGAFDDEPSHVVTGVMLRQWIEDGFPAPLAYAKDYYVHYPKVAFGQWPPVFYVLQAGWMLFGGVGVTSLVTLMALLNAAVALFVYSALREDTGEGCAFAAGLGYLLLPLSQELGGMVLTEVPLALFCSIAVWRFGRFLEDGRGRDLFLFGTASFLAIMTKGNALALALVPPLVILACRRWDLLRHGRMWLVAAVLGATTAPWYWLALRFSSSTWVQAGPSLAYAQAATRYYALGLLHAGGWGVSTLALLGLAGGLCGPRERRGRWVALSAWGVAWAAMHLAVPSSREQRHLLLLLPLWTVAAASGAALVVRRLPRAPRWVAALLLLAPLVLEHPGPSRKDLHGYGTLAERLVSDPSLARSAFLIASDASGEGAFVAALAVRQADPPRYVLRASKVLASSDWMGRGYRTRFPDARELEAWLEAFPVGIVVVDAGTRESQRFAHFAQLLEAVTAPDGPWEELPPEDLRRGARDWPGGLRVFRQRGHETRDVSSLAIEDLLETGFF